MVRSHLDYCALCESGHHIEKETLYEKLQERATKMLSELKNLSYRADWNHVISTLHHRRLISIKLSGWTDLGTRKIITSIICSHFFIRSLLMLFSPCSPLLRSLWRARVQIGIFFQVHGRYFRSDDLLDDTNDFCGCWRESKLCSMDESPGP